MLSAYSLRGANRKPAVLNSHPARASSVTVFP